MFFRVRSIVETNYTKTGKNLINGIAIRTENSSKNVNFWGQGFRKAVMTAESRQQASLSGAEALNHNP